MKKWIVCLLTVSWVLSMAARAEVSVLNVSAAQRPGTKLVDISYDVSSTETNAVTVSLSVSNGTTAVACPTVSGDVGEGVATGTGKSIAWNGGADWDGNLSGSMAFAVMADEGLKPDMVAISAGTNSGTDPDFGAYSLTNDSTFYMDETEVTKAQWDTVYNWAVVNGYSFGHAGSGKGTDHPVQTVSWYDCVKWCNARSEKEGKTPCYTVSGSTYKTGESAPDCNFEVKGYRLPTSDEWEYAARGGLNSKRFPWGDTINHDNANYRAHGSAYSYDTSPYTSYTYHPDYDEGGTPYTSPAGDFAANGYGLYDMIGNVWEWCTDWHPDYVGSSRVLRGGGWSSDAGGCRSGYVIGGFPNDVNYYIGFRAVLSAD